MWQIQIHLDSVGGNIAEVIDVARRSDVESVPAAFATFAVVVLYHTEPANLFGREADRRIWVVVADFSQFDAAREIGGHDIAACFVEDRFFDPGIGCAECFPVPETGI